MKIKKVFNKVVKLVKKARSPRQKFEWNYDQKAREILNADVNKFHMMTTSQVFDLLFRIADGLQQAYIEGYERGKINCDK